METIVKLIKPALLKVMFVFCYTGAMAQANHPHMLARISKKRNHILLKSRDAGSQQFKQFSNLLTQSDITFNFPAGFREIAAINNEDFTYDYAMEIPGREFEVWFQVRSIKENWKSYERNHQQENPDSTYLNKGKAQAIAFSGENDYLVRSVPANVLTRYNADAGKSYLLNLLDFAETKHYKYALLITLQRNHVGNFMAVCFTNEKGPEFFKNIDKASNCLRFKP